MRVCVYGLWHLGCVTAACLAHGGHDVIAVDPDTEVVAQLRQGRTPLFEPGLDDLINSGLATGRLRFDADPALAAHADVVWITFDTPVDDNDAPQPSIVVDHVVSLFRHVSDGCLILLSSQLPAGTTRRLAAAAAKAGCHHVTFSYSPENLRLGRAIEVFTRPDRVVVGLQTDDDRGKVSALLAPFTDNIEWMGIEAAEMTKHAINAFLAASVAFMNEIATICEKVGADAKEVERGLKSEQRIGPRAYLSPGGAFAGGTLARDVTTLTELAQDFAVPARLVGAVRESNDGHRFWALRKLEERFGAVAGRRVAILGLTYKAGTNTLRRSSAVELALALRALGAAVVAFDPAVLELPAELAGRIELAPSVGEAIARADAAVLATPWPEFRGLDWSSLGPTMATPTVIDPSWFLAEALRNHPGIAYVAVGRSWPTI
jgi:UDPglucose 6-dehydrogenase